MSIESQIEGLATARNTIRTKMMSAGQATRNDKLSTLASNLEISTGTDTSDATATASDILNGKTAYVNGTKVTGDITIATSSEIKHIVNEIFPELEFKPSSGSFTKRGISSNSDSDTLKEAIKGTNIYAKVYNHDEDVTDKCTYKVISVENGGYYTIEATYKNATATGRYMYSDSVYL